nr:large tegument protein UL36 [Psittacid alphaherpesvirus 6]
MNGDGTDDDDDAIYNTQGNIRLLGEQRSSGAGRGEVVQQTWAEAIADVEEFRSIGTEPVGNVISNTNDRLDVVTRSDLCCSCDDWAVGVLDAVGAPIVAVGTCNIYDQCLPPGASVSCLRASLAFLRVAFCFGNSVATSASTIDSLLVHGAMWTSESTELGLGPYRTCDAHELPRIIIGESGIVTVAFSATYGEVPFYFEDDSEERVLDTQMSAKRFFEEIWKTRTDMAASVGRATYGLVIIGAMGIAILDPGNTGYSYVFDPHGHGRERRAFTAKVPNGELYKYLTSYAEPTAGTYWSGTFVYLLTSVKDELTVAATTEEEIRAAVAGSYGSSDVAFERRSDLPGMVVRVKGEIEPPGISLGEHVNRTTVIIGSAKGLSEETSTNVSAPIPSERVWSGDMSGGNWEEAITASGTEVLSGGNLTDRTQIGRDRDRRIGPKRRRPVWSPPSSTEDVATVVSTDGLSSIGNLDNRRMPRKFRRGGRPGRGSRPITNGTNGDMYTTGIYPSVTRSGSSSELTEAASGVTYLPAPQNNTTPIESGRGESGTDFTTETAIKTPIPAKAAYEALRRRGGLNPHVAFDIAVGPEGLWTDNYLHSYPLDNLREKTRDVAEATETAMSTTVTVCAAQNRMGTPGISESLPIILTEDAFERLFACAIENGARSTPDASSGASHFLDATVTAFPKHTAFVEFLKTTHLILSETGAASSSLQKLREENSPIGRLILYKLWTISTDVDVASADLHDALDTLEKSVIENERVEYEMLATVLSDAAPNGMGKPGLFTERLQTRTCPERLSDRVRRLCASVRESEDETQRMLEMLNGQIDAIDKGVRHMTKTLDSFVLGGSSKVEDREGPDDTLTAIKPVAITVASPSELEKVLNDLITAACDAVAAAVREYYTESEDHASDLVLEISNADGYGDMYDTYGEDRRSNRDSADEKDWESDEFLASGSGRRRTTRVKRKERKKPRRNKQKWVPERFAPPTNNVVQGLIRLGASLPRLDLAISETAGALPGTKVKGTVSNCPASRLLKELLDTGPQIAFSDDRLEEWKTAMASARVERIIDRQELDKLFRQIDIINAAAAKASGVESADQALDALRRALAAADRQAGAETSYNETALGDLVSSLEEVARAYDRLISKTSDSSRSVNTRRTSSRSSLDAIKLDQSGRQSAIPDSIRNAVDEAAQRLRVARARSEELREGLASIRSALTASLRPLKDFGGLRTLGTTYKDLGNRAADFLGFSSDRGPEALEFVINTSPVEVLGELRSDFTNLLSQYRTALERPTTTTTMTLSGLGKQFAVATKMIFGSSGGFPEAAAFFENYADDVVVAVTEAAAGFGTGGGVSLSILAERASRAERVLSAAERSVIMASESAIGSGLSTKTDAEDRAASFAFLGALRRFYADSAAVYHVEDLASAILSELAVVTDSVVTILNEIKATDATELPRAELEIEMRTSIERTVASLAKAEHIVASASLSSRTHEAITKAVAVTKTRRSELETAWGALVSDREKTVAIASEKEWHEECDTMLANAAERSEFDITRMTRLLNIGTTLGYVSKQTAKKKAADVISTHRNAVIQAIDDVFRFNPYDPEHYESGAVPPLSGLRDLTWSEPFVAVSSIFSELFGVDVGPLLAALRTATVIVMYAEANSDTSPMDYRALLELLDREESTRLPLLHKYVGLYCRGRDAFDAFKDRSKTRRATVAHALGRIPTEITRVLEQAAAIKTPDAARNALRSDGSWSPKKQDKNRPIPIVWLPAAAELSSVLISVSEERLQRFGGTAYEKAVKAIHTRDVADVTAALNTAKDAELETSARAVAILNEVIAAGDADDKNTAEGLANLKNLLRLVSSPASISKAIDAATSVEDIVTQLALLLAQAEKATEVDPQTIEWLRHARAVIDSHPMAVLIDETGPATPYAARVDALVELRVRVDALKATLCAAETAWDEAWAVFNRDKDKASRSYDGTVAARQAACQLEATGNVVLALRSDKVYTRLPASLLNRVEAKRIEREAGLSQLIDALNVSAANRKSMKLVMDRIPEAYTVEVLRALAKRYDELVPSVPKWFANGAARYRALIDIRLAMYAAYESTRPAWRKAFATVPNPHAVQSVDSSAWSEAARREARVVMWMGTKAVTTLKEIVSDIDSPGVPTYAGVTQIPLRYSVCYRNVLEKMAVAACVHELASTALPKLADEPLMREDTEAAAVVLSEIMALRLEYSRAAADHFEAFSRFVRTRRSPWPLSENRRAVAEIYSAVLATTLTRSENVKWSSVYLFPAAAWARAEARTQRVFGKGVTTPDTREPTSLPLTVTADPEEIRAGLSMSSEKEVLMDPGDIMTAIATWAPGHVQGFATLDLFKQHEYMDRTLQVVLDGALGETIFVNCLERPSSTQSQNWRPLSLGGNIYDPSRGSLFSISYSDWRPGRLSQTDPLKPWEDAGVEAVAGLAKIRDTIKTEHGILMALSMLARVCIPPKALATLWTVLRPDEIEAAIGHVSDHGTITSPNGSSSFDDMLHARSCATEHVSVLETVDVPTAIDAAASITSSDPSTRTCGPDDEAPPPPENIPLYKPTGKLASFTVVSASSSSITKTNAVDVAAAAVLFGARLVVVAECPGAYSEASGLTLCIKLFDTRDGSYGRFIDSSAVSTDPLSIGRRLLGADPNPIENACLSSQLEDISALLAEKPLANAPPCMLVVGEGLEPKHILWAKSGPPPAAPYVRLTFEDGTLDELPYVDTTIQDVRDSYEDTRDINYDALMNPKLAVEFLSRGHQAYQQPKYRDVYTSDAIGRKVISPQFSTVSRDFPGPTSGEDLTISDDNIASGIRLPSSSSFSDTESSSSIEVERPRIKSTTRARDTDRRSIVTHDTSDSVRRKNKLTVSGRDGQNVPMNDQRDTISQNESLPANDGYIHNTTGLPKTTDQMIANTDYTSEDDSDEFDREDFQDDQYIEDFPSMSSTYRPDGVWGPYDEIGQNRDTSLESKKREAMIHVPEVEQSPSPVIRPHQETAIGPQPDRSRSFASPIPPIPKYKKSESNVLRRPAGTVGERRRRQRSYNVDRKLPSATKIKPSVAVGGDVDSLSEEEDPNQIRREYSGGHNIVTEKADIDDDIEEDEYGGSLRPGDHRNIPHTKPDRSDLPLRSRPLRQGIAAVGTAAAFAESDDSDDARDRVRFNGGSTGVTKFHVPTHTSEEEVSDDEKYDDDSEISESDASTAEHGDPKHKPPVLPRSTERRWASLRQPTRIARQDRTNVPRTVPASRRATYSTVSEEESTDEQWNPEQNRTAAGKLISSDALLRDRRKFRAATRGAMWYLMKTCEKIAEAIGALRKDLDRRNFDVYAELAKIRLLLIT